MAINPRDRGEFAASMGVGHSSSAPRPPVVYSPPMPEIDGWWVGGAVQGPSEYGAEYTFKKPDVSGGEVGSAKYLTPTLLQQHTLAHFSGAGYAKRARSASRAIFPSWKDSWISETRRNFPPIPLKKEPTFGRRDLTMFWNDLAMFPKSWGFPRQDTWVCPSYIRRESMRDEKTFPSDGRVVSLESIIPISKLQTEFQAAYKGAQPKPPFKMQRPRTVRQLHGTLLAPDMYKTSSDVIGARLP